MFNKTIITILMIITAIGAQSTSSLAEPTDKLSLGIDMFDHQLFNLAAHQFREYIHQNPTASDLDLAQFYLAHCDQSLGNYHQAIQEYRDLLITYPGSSLVDAGWLELSRCYMKKGDEASAEEALRKALSLPMKKEVNFAAHSELGTLLYNQNQFEQAVSVYLRLMEANPDLNKTAWERYRLAQVYITLEDYQKAIVQLELIDSSEPHPLLKALTNYHLAHCRAALGQLEEALGILDYDQLFPEEMLSHKLFLQASLQVALNEYPQALETLNELIEARDSMSPQVPILQDPTITTEDIRIISAWLDFQLGDHISAEAKLAEVYSQAKDADTQAQTLFLIGYLSYQRENYPFALEYFAKFASDFPHHPYLVQAIYYRGWCHYKMEDYEQARDIFSTLLAQNPQIEESPYFAFLVGECDYKTKRYQRAMEDFELFTRNYPQSSLYLHGFLRTADCLFQLGENEQAVDHYRDFIDKYPQSDITPLAYWNLGRAYNNLGQTEEMRDVYIEFITNFPDHELADDSALAMVRSLYLEGKYELCIGWVDDFTDRLPKSDFAPKMLWYKGKSLYDLTRYDSAMKVFVYIHKNYSATIVGQDALYYTYLTDQKLGKYSNPLTASVAFLNEHPQSSLAPKVKILVAQYYSDERNFSYATKLLKEILSEEEDIGILREATEKLADIYKRQGMDIDAAEVYVWLAERMKRSPSRYDYLLKAAGLYNQGGLAEEAIDIYQVLLDEIPHDPRISTVLYNLGLIYKDLRMFESAQVILDKLVREWQSSKEYLLGCFQLAFVYQYLADLPNAIKYHKIVTYNAGADLAVQSMYWVGKCYYDLREFPSAEEWLKRLVREYSTHTAWVNKADALLEKIY